MPALKPTPKILTTLLVRVCLSILLVWYLYCLLVPAGKGAVTRDVSFPAGSGIRKLAADLKSGGIIRSTWHFVLVSRLRGQAQRLKAGDYRFNDGMSTAEILRKVAAGEVDFRRFALPEGYSIYQAAELLEQQGIFKKDVFLEKCRDSALLARLGVPGSSVEGYLFPATYNLSLNGTEEQLISQMVAHFNKMAGSLDLTGRSGLTLHKLVTLASLIEKEAVSPEEKPLISSVFHNRLRLGMPLQSDPTSVYGVRAFAGKVTKKDIGRQSEYNTYLNRGLPPGPIGNPGADALQAALQPADTPYLYFVARQNGTHQFSRTLEEHNRAVNHYLRR
ncbi:endolytic transglycosylase MltG [Geobacter sp. SVR]|uniref:endolytic transglycosylase MltG n=1 Tax=Geobacter sp. SVR TaxID=2495594 RepID=UPI00143EF733|nr:endolytic transglycosylase MltG [Geobacter sp. SVR]BCS53161.1 aminodeoxychorismate lyase [Geobacter sp. SVR]GCF84546.1 aminodeoxychorismate lyase [Geobacter sp. SVR]